MPKISQYDSGTPIPGDFIVYVDSTISRTKKADISSYSYSKSEVDSLISSIGGSGGNSIYNETPTGSINGINTIFTLSNSCVLGSTRLFLNGMRQKLGGDYTETSPTTIAFITPPLTGDNVILDYTLFI